MSAVVENHWPDVIVRIQRDIKEGVAKAGLDLERQILGNITTRGLVDTGNYRRSWTTSIEDGGLTAEIGSPVEYGVYLEYGTRFMPGRPHLVPAADTIRSRIVSYFRSLGR